MDSSDQDHFDRARFATILRNLNRDRIPSFASAVRYSGHPSTGIIDVPTTPRPVSCRLLSHITCGSYNAIFKVLFADGTLWVLKVPASGHRQCWNAPASEALTSEAFTMRLIRRETTIPVPEVFAFDASLENDLGCPFILMEMIHGKSLLDVWFDQGLSHAKREQIRIRSLQGIAEAMAQLNTLTFSQGGSLLFDAKGDVVGIGSSNIVDLEAQYANMRSTDYDNTMAYCQTGPFSDPQSYLLSLIGNRKESREPNVVEQGAYKLLRLFIEWTFMDTNAGQEKKLFVLAHPDLDNQNIIVNDDGSLAGIIDWDWIAAVPHCIGPQSLPKFLTQDYDPGSYAYDVEAGEPKEGYLADSPSELASYRAMYAQFMESHLSRDDRINLAKGRRRAVRKSRKDAADMTRRSLITTSLYLAARAPSEMQQLMVHIFDELEDLTAAEWPEESSTADSGEQDSSEEGGNKAGNSEATEVDSGDVVGEESCFYNARSEEKAVSIELLSIDELVDEIEKLTGTLSAGNSNNDNKQDQGDVEETSPAGGKIPEPEIEAHGPSIVEPTKEARKPRAARVCGWFKEKLRGGAKRLHKKPKKDNATASAAPAPTSRRTRAAQTFCSWTEKKLRQVAHCLHCDDDDRDKAKIESKIEAVRNGGIEVLERLQTRLLLLRQNLCRKGYTNPETSEGSEQEVSQNQQVTNVPKELTRAEKRSLCGKFAHLLQENKLRLTVDQQIAVVHWVIATLQNPEFSDKNDHLDEKPERHEGDGSGRDGDSGDDSGYEEGQEDGNGTSADGTDGNDDTEEVEHRCNEENNTEPTDRAAMEQPLAPSLSEESDHLAIEPAGTTSNEKEPIELPQPAVAPTAKKPEHVDTGAFTLFDICVALAKDDLDERRMQRLRDGFFGLLNQTM